LTSGLEDLHLAQIGINSTYFTCFGKLSMRLDLHTDYALRTLIFLAGRPGRSSVAEVAAFYGISRDHVAKVVQALGKMGYVRSQRGAGGGIELARSPEQIRIGQVIAAFEGNLHLLECVGTENVCTIQPGCRLRRVLAHAERIQREYLDSVRLSDVVEPGGGLREFAASSSPGQGTWSPSGPGLLQIALPSEGTSPGSAFPRTAPLPASPQDASVAAWGTPPAPGRRSSPSLDAPAKPDEEFPAQPDPTSPP
jgi:Rrf2 family nitric oxide-sensitive transcriptional repressor